MSQYFYSGQTRRFLAQFIRVMSGFKVYFGRDTNGNEIYRTVPCTYGDPSRQVAQIMRSNSANTSLTVPQISCYITSLEYARDRIQEPYFVKKVQVIERAIDPETGDYMNAPGNKFTVERLMPVPYDLTVKADIWTSSTDQKMQLLEQLCVLFNPSLEIQGSDNFLDWTSLSMISLESVSWSSRQVPVGTEDPIDIASLTFKMPIWYSTPAKVKKMGVITNIVENIYDADGNVRSDLADQGFTAADFILNVNLAGSGSQMSDYATPTNAGGPLNYQIPDPDTPYEPFIHSVGRPISGRSSVPYNLIVLNGVVRAVRNYQPGKDQGPNDNVVPYDSTYVAWSEVIALWPVSFQDGVTQLYLRQSDTVDVVGVIALDPTDITRMLITIDADTVPSNTLAAVDRIVDPLKSGPGHGLVAVALGQRYLLLNDTGTNSDLTDAPAWRGEDDGELVAKKFDIVEYNGSRWVVSFSPSGTTEPQYVTNLANGQQFKWDGFEWLRSWEGLYNEGEWRLA